MRRRQDPGSSIGFNVWMGVGWFLILVVGAVLIWFGFFRPVAEEPAPVTVEPSAIPTAEPLPTALPTDTPTPVPTDTPSPTPEPTQVPPTMTPAVAKVVVGPDAINVRSGPGTEYTRLGTLDADTEALVTGQYGGWWQIEYQGQPAWVYGEIVTASNTEAVAQVQPPPTPSPAPAAPTAVPTDAPATSGPPPAADTRGLVVNDYWVEGAPGPYAAGAPIWFNIDMTNKSAQEVKYSALGTWVEETGQYQKSYFAVPPSYPSLIPNQHFTHRDRIIIPAAGTYNLWLAIQFDDGASARLAGPVVVTVQ